MQYLIQPQHIVLIDEGEVSYIPRDFSMEEDKLLVKALEEGDEASINRVLFPLAYFSERLSAQGIRHIQVRNSRLIATVEKRGVTLEKEVSDRLVKDLVLTKLVEKVVIKSRSLTLASKLISFILNNNLTLLDNGNFIAYKAVNPNLTDLYTGKLNHVIGEDLRLFEDEVDTTSGASCSKGLHFASMKFAESFGNSNSRYLELEVNSYDVVAVHGSNKGRGFGYKILREVKV